MPDALDINIDDLPDDCRQIAEIIGLEGLLALSAQMGGERIHIPLPDRLATAARNRKIRAEFNGRNYHALALKYNLTVRWIRAIVAGQMADSPKSCDGPIYKQRKMF